LSADVQSRENLALQQPVGPGRVVVAVAGRAGNAGQAVVVVVGLVAQVGSHGSPSCAGGLRVCGCRDEVVLVLEGDESVRVLHGVVHAAVADQHSGEVDDRGRGSCLLRVEIQNGICPGGDVVPSVAFSCDDELAAHEIREEQQPILIEGDEVVRGLCAGLGLGAKSERVAYILWLIQVQNLDKTSVHNISLMLIEKMTMSRILHSHEHSKRMDLMTAGQNSRNFQELSMIL